MDVSSGDLHLQEPCEKDYTTTEFDKPREMEPLNDPHHEIMQLLATVLLKKGTFQNAHLQVHAVQ